MKRSFHQATSFFPLQNFVTALPSSPSFNVWMHFFCEEPIDPRFLKNRWILEVNLFSSSILLKRLIQHSKFFFINSSDVSRM